MHIRGTKGWRRDQWKRQHHRDGCKSCSNTRKYLMDITNFTTARNKQKGCYKQRQKDLLFEKRLSTINDWDVIDIIDDDDREYLYECYYYDMDDYLCPKPFTETIGTRIIAPIISFLQQMIDNSLYPYQITWFIDNAWYFCGISYN